MSTVIHVLIPITSVNSYIFRFHVTPFCVLHSYANKKIKLCTASMPEIYKLATIQYKSLVICIVTK